jgi:hypothetical protein
VRCLAARHNRFAVATDGANAPDPRAARGRFRFPAPLPTDTLQLPSKRIVELEERYVKPKLLGEQLDRETTRYRRRA